MAQQLTMDKLVALCKARGFIFAGSEIYGGLANTWDYGPLGVELKKNIKAAWWQKFVQESKHNVGIDSSILMNPQTWVASGHLANFADPLLDCKACKARYRADQLIEGWYGEKGEPVPHLEGKSNAELKAIIDETGIPCPKCGAKTFSDIRQFNLMFKTFQGVTEDSKAEIYLRPETAQGIFTNFKNVQRTTRRKIPFGIGQIGKSFRNEITPGNFIFRTREFEQMELEFFCKPGEDLEWFQYWRQFCIDWLKAIGMRAERLRFRDHEKEELSHYSKATTDIEYLFPHGWGELWGIADRTDFDLKSHQTVSGEDLTYLDPETNEKYLPYVIEPSLGVERLLLALMTDAYEEQEIAEGDVRTVLHFHPAIAPVKVAVLPLSKKLSEPATALYDALRRQFAADYDEAGSIGKRYRRQDEIGTPYCVTFDFDSLNDNAVTVRDRDSMEQVRLPIDQLSCYLAEKVALA
ncbi:MAG: glycine--tRNA ligase [Chloroflexota bacterium]